MLASIIAAVALAASVHASPGVVQVGSVIGGANEGYNPPMMDSIAPPMASSLPSAAPSAAQSAPPSGQTQVVTVGGTSGLVYTPECVFANIGDVIIFNYGTKNHTLTQSSFAEPCTEMTSGIQSGFMPTDGSTSPQFTVTVTTTSPQWFYCQQTGHCKMGMVFAINPPTSGDNTFSNFKMLAMGTSTVTSTATTSATVTTVAPPPAPPPPPPGMVSGSNIGTNGQCFCVCNMALGNGVPNPAIQGLDTFGGTVGQVQSPFAAGQIAAAAAPPPAGSAAASAAAFIPPPASLASVPPASAPPASFAPPATVASGATASVAPLLGAGLGSLNVGSVIPFGNAVNPPPASSPTATTADPPAQDIASPTTADSSTPTSPSDGSAAGFAANPPGGAAGRLFKF